jgi:hypothetical protein
MTVQSFSATRVGHMIACRTGVAAEVLTELYGPVGLVR